MTEWLKRLRGYVKIRVWGFAPQRFINLCSNKGILLWNIEKQDDVYIMCVSLESFYRLRSIARKTKVRVVISERYGLPFFLPHLQRRKAFLAGLVLTVMIGPLILGAWLDLGLHYFWAVSCTFLIVLSLVGWRRYKQGKWRDMLVVEKTPPGGDRADAE